MEAMRLRAIPFILAVGIAVSVAGVSTRAQTYSPSPVGWLGLLRDDAARLIKTATSDDFAWQRLAELTDTYGARLSGSDNLRRATEWAVAAMKADGLENVRTEPVMVQRWVRGEERAQIIDPPEHDLEILGLGGTVA